MSLVGPGGLGKIRLVFAMLASPKTFYPKLQKTYDFVKDYQPIFREMAGKPSVEIGPCLDFEMIRKLENCLPVFEDSCEIYQEKKLSRSQLPEAMKSHCIFVKHNLFLRSK